MVIKKVLTILNLLLKPATHGHGEKNAISFSLNGVNHKVDDRHPLTMSLNEYLRDVLQMTGFVKLVIFCLRA